MVAESAGRLDLRVVGSVPRSRAVAFDVAPPAGTLVAIPVRTRLIAPHDDLPSVVGEAVRGIARPGDVLALSETAVAIAQNRFTPAEFVRPSKLAYVLSRYADPMATVSQPESLQLVIDQVGAKRVAFAGLMHVVGHLRGKRGAFYKILGEAIATIDGYTGTLPPYERTIVFGPHEPASVAQSIADATQIETAIVDVNDLGIAKVLGASRGVAERAVERALVTNPHGNGDEQTPLVVLAWRGAQGSPLLATP